MAQIIELFSALKQRFDSLEGALMPYALTASLVMTLAPSLVVFPYLVSYDEAWINEMIQILGRYLPEDLIHSALDYYRQRSSIGIVFAFTTVWAASKNPAHFLMLNKKNQKSQIPNLVLRVLAVGITLEMMLLLCSVVLLYRFFPKGNLLTSEFVFLFGLLWFYHRVSLKRRGLKDELPGAICAWIGIQTIGLFFFYYVNEIAFTSELYGPLSSMVIVLLSCFAISNMIYFGYCINEILQDGIQREAHYPSLEKLGVEYGNVDKKDRHQW